MIKVINKLFAFCNDKYAYSGNIIRNLQSEEMNKVTLFIVFLCGVTFSVLVSLIGGFWRSMHSTDGTLGSSLGALPAGAEIDLMDDGYVTMALLGAHEDEQAVTKKQTTELEDRHAEIEALNTLKAAKDLVHSGKRVRAGRLLEHAISLAPRHPDVLVHYGEYLEQQRNDIIQADKLYLRALAVSPANSRALRNRRRTRPIVDEMDQQILLRIDGKRDELAQIPSSSAALRRIKKEAYFQYIYHTAGLEGNTMTLSQTRMILETRLSVGGKSVMEHNEILGLDLALRFINTTLVHRVGRISMYDILEIHRRVLGHVDPIEAGRLRTTQVYVSDHVPPPPTHLQVLMEDFVVWLNSPEAQKLHPIKYAALAHYKLVFIHPFSDGNGRTARLLMNFLLMQAGYPPVIIRKQDRMVYYDGLQTANDGDTRPFVRFIAHCTEKTLDVYLWATKEALPKIGQEFESSLGEEKIRNSDGKEKFNSDDANIKESSEYVKYRRKIMDEAEEDIIEESKFVFTPVDEISELESAEEKVVKNERKSEPRQTFIPPITEDSIMKDDSGISSDDDNEEDYSDDGYRDHLWFSIDEEKVKVRGMGRFSKVLDEEDIYEAKESADKTDIEDVLEFDDNRLPHTL